MTDSNFSLLSTFLVVFFRLFGRTAKLKPGHDDAPSPLPLPPAPLDGRRPPSLSSTAASLPALTADDPSGAAEADTG